MNMHETIYFFRFSTRKRNYLLAWQQIVLAVFVLTQESIASAKLTSMKIADRVKGVKYPPTKKRQAVAPMQKKRHTLFQFQYCYQSTCCIISASLFTPNCYILKLSLRHTVNAVELIFSMLFVSLVDNMRLIRR